MISVGKKEFDWRVLVRLASRLTMMVPDGIKSSNQLVRQRIGLGFILIFQIGVQLTHENNNRR